MQKSTVSSSILSIYRDIFKTLVYLRQIIFWLINTFVTFVTEFFVTFMHLSQKMVEFVT